ncbi:hypothetical protein [Sphingomonas sp. Leaf343]|uniref:hypothetical protein n=1 Tax=Sphingomonas sp. Leaf343 TaxID=1736345 RepID=UPI000A5C1FA8|nr:hypothetical protein [Sphingomonas sp. Leaf343]
MSEPERPVAPERRWTQTDITLLRDRVEAGDVVDDIASVLARSPAGVRQMMVRLALAR